MRVRQTWLSRVLCPLVFVFLLLLLGFLLLFFVFFHRYPACNGKEENTDDEQYKKLETLNMIQKFSFDNGFHALPHIFSDKVYIAQSEEQNREEE